MTRPHPQPVASRAPRGGPTSNSDPADTFYVAAVGVHTVSFAWRGCTPSAFPPGIATVSSRTGEVLPIERSGPRHRIIKDPVSGSRVGCSVTSNGCSTWVEGTLSGILADRKMSSLAPAHRLPAGALAAAELARSMSVALPDAHYATVRRCDLAVDFWFVVPADGLALLRGAATLSLPEYKSVVRGGRGSSNVQSVAWETARRIALRVYDKSSEERRAGATDAPGRVVRVERQHCPRSAEQVSTDEYGRQDLAAVFAHPLSSWSDERILIATPSGAYWIVKGLIGRPVLPAGRVLTPRVAERMIGSLMQLQEEGDAAWSNRRTALTRRRELRSLGVEVNPLAQTVIDVGALFRTASAAWATATASHLSASGGTA